MTVTVFGNLYEEIKYHSCIWRSVHPPDCPPAWPTDSSSHFCPKNSICHQQKTLAHRVIVMKINHCDRQPSRLRLQGTFPQKTASVPTSERVIQCQFSVKKMTFFHFPGCLVSQYLNHYTSLQHPYNCKLSAGLDWQEDTWETPTSSTWRVPSRLFRSHSVGFLCELHGGTAEMPHTLWPGTHTHTHLDTCSLMINVL